MRECSLQDVEPRLGDVARKSRELHRIVVASAFADSSTLTRRAASSASPSIAASMARRVFSRASRSMPSLSRLGSARRVFVLDGGGGLQRPAAAFEGSGSVSSSTAQPCSTGGSGSTA